MSKQNKKNRLKPVLAIALPILLIATAAAVRWSGGEDATENIPTFEVRRGPLTISIDASGTIKALDQEVITCKVKGEGYGGGGGATILTLVPEGTHVKKGDLLIGLDSSSFEDQLVAEEITLQTAETTLLSTQENLAVGKNQAESDKEQAQLALTFAKEDLTKYEEGDYKNELTDARSQIVVKEEAAQQAADKYKWSEQLFAEKYISETELKADELALSRTSLDVQLAKSKLQLLMDFTYKRQMAQLESDKWQAGMALERADRKAKADVVLLEAALYEAQSRLERQKEVVRKLETNIANTMIYAPADGMVVYATSQDHHRGNTEPLDVGQQVRERQELIHLPTSDKVKAEIKVHESSMRKVKVGLPVVVTVDALSERTFTGRVVKIAMLPDAQMVWLNPDLKIYTTEVHIDGDNSDLRTGMSCRASIVIEQYGDVVYVPVQAVVRIGEQPTVYVIKDGKNEPRNVEIGLDNNRMVHVISGLEVGERVKLAPPLAPAEAQDVKARKALGQSDGAGPADSGSVGTDDGGKQAEDKPDPPGRRKPVDPRDT
ncbi:MAG: HlyD family efflux transporter periplasmic adaptor subunit [Planctomycetes bacterium]|nr:HlyD family efflux transporter periplasmic adaptor subunit [Planctomycetota bacterium]